MTDTKRPALEVSDLTAELSSGERIVDGVSLALHPGEIVGLVGESGSGKTTTALSLLGYTGSGVSVTGGMLRLGEVSVPARDVPRSVRGRLISYVPQNTGSALNPALRLGRSLRDMIDAHHVRGSETDPSRLLASVDLPTSADFAKRFPHQISGGQQQRVCIALSMAGQAGVIVLDEPTTGLDVVTQQRILDELQTLRDERGIAMLYVTHDLSVLARLADRVAVMYAGEIVEIGPVDEVIRRPRHPYTRGLVASIPDHVRPGVLEPIVGLAPGIGERPEGCAFAPRCPQSQPLCSTTHPRLTGVGVGHEVRCLEWESTPPLKAPLPLSVRQWDESPPLLVVDGLRASHGTGREEVVAASDISFDVRRGECVALVGESGSGKTTIARTVAGLHEVGGGTVRLGGERLPSGIRRRSSAQLRGIQLVSQNPLDALNPRHNVLNTISRPAKILRGMSSAGARAEALSLLEMVRLPSRLADRYPGELSGGERQRVAIARALAATPELLVCDEVTSALDVSVQAAVLKLLADLRDELDLALLFITHDLGVVAAIADRILVLEKGLLCEQGDVAEVLDRPAHPYTQLLLKAAPSLSEGMA